MPMKPVRYRIAPDNPAAHLFKVEITLDAPDPQGQRFMLPVWIPGSYMVREFARNIVTMCATDVATGTPARIEKIDKHRWQAAPVKGALKVCYQVYAWDLSVRAAYLDHTGGFFNGASVFLMACGQEDAPCVVHIGRLRGQACHHWRVATALPEARGTQRYGFGAYHAANYDELIDHPVTMGEFALATYEAHGVPHDVALAGRMVSLDMERLCADLKRICEAQIALFEPRTKRAPMQRYVFMTHVMTEGYGGLEHRASTALVCRRDALPAQGIPAVTEGYRTYLGLCSHEYFHAWNIKRIKPAAFAHYDLAQENYTSLLWLFEGFTSYYDDLMLVRSGVISQDDYLAMLGKTIAGVLRGAGRLRQSVAQSSFDAWIKYYRQDENAANAIVSYYTKGALVALAFDLAIRAQTKGARSLDDLMRLLWRRYGRDFYAGQRTGIAEDEVQSLLAEATGVALGPLFGDAVHGTRDLPLAALFKPFGITLEAETEKGARVSLGARIKNEGVDCVLAVVHENGAAQKAGLSAGDVLVALDGLRVTRAGLDRLLARYQPGDKVMAHAFHCDELRAVSLTLDAPDVARYRLEVSDTRAHKLRAQWLTGKGRAR